jgi:hypothetical protein
MKEKELKMRKFKMISVPIPADPTSISLIVGVVVFVLGMAGYIIGDIRQPPAPEPTAQIILVTPTAAPGMAMPTPWPTAIPTQQIPPTSIEVQAQPPVLQYGAVQPIIDSAAWVPEQPTVESVQPAAAPVNDLVTVQEIPPTSTPQTIDVADPRSVCATVAAPFGISTGDGTNGWCLITGADGQQVRVEFP